MALTDSHTSYYDLIEYIVGIIGIFLGVIAGVAIHRQAKSIEQPYRFHTALTTLSACLVVASLLPQLIRNSAAKEQMVDNVSPFIPGIRPFIILVGVFTMHDYVLLANRHKTALVAIVQFIFHFIDLILYIAWTFQYAEYTTSVVESAIMYALGAFYTCAAVWFLWSLCQVLTTTIHTFFTPKRTPIQPPDDEFESSSDDEPITRPPVQRSQQRFYSNTPYRL